MIEFSNVSITTDFGDYTKFPEIQHEEISRLEALREFYLIDLRMMGTGELFSESGDLMTVGGLSNLAQALTHRLMTERGTHPMDSTLGIPWRAYMGQTYSEKDLIRYELMQEIISEIYKDIRVREVTSIDVDFIDVNVISVEVSVAPTGVGGIFNISLDVTGIGD